MKKAAEAEAEATKKDLAAKPEGATAAAKAELAAPVRYDWRTSAYVGPLFANRLTAKERDSLTHFGHELFAPTPGAALLLENIPVAPGYVVGPGDEIVVKMWGRVEGTQRMVVDRDGKIFLPKFGSLYVAGKTFEEMRAFLKAKVSTIAEVSSDVTLGQMKGIRVSVVGEVRAPGWYNVSSLHTALQALSIAGGMKDIGSLRRIKILRAGQVVREIDLYEFLLSGDTRADIRLLQGDVIFVPVVGKLAAIAGEVRRPAIYELRDEKSLLDLVRVAGGFAPSAYKRRVQVERLEGNVARIVLDTNAEELETGRQPFPLSDGDIVRVLPIVLADENVVTLEGNVYRPGKYELKPGMTVGSAPPGREGVPPRDVLRLRAPHAPGPPRPAQGGHPRQPAGDRAGEEEGGRRRAAGAGQAYGLQPLRLPRPAEGDHLRRGAADAPEAGATLNAESRLTPKQGLEPSRRGEPGHDGENRPGRRRKGFLLSSWRGIAGRQERPHLRDPGGDARGRPGQDGRGPDPPCVPRARRGRSRRREPRRTGRSTSTSARRSRATRRRTSSWRTRTTSDPLDHGDAIQENRHGLGGGEQPGGVRPDRGDAPVRPPLQGRRVPGERLHEGGGADPPRGHPAGGPGEDADAGRLPGEGASRGTRPPTSP